MTSNLIIFTKINYVENLILRLNGISKIKYIVFSELNYESNPNRVQELSNKFKEIKFVTYPQFLPILNSSNKDFLCGISFMFSEKFQKKTIERFQKGIVNFHPSLLPLNRGADPITWAIFEKSDHGVSAHLVEDLLDTGPILSQKKIKIEPFHTVETLYELSMYELEKLVELVIPKWLNDEIIPIVQIGKSSFHTKADLMKLKNRNIHDFNSIEELLHLLRATSFDFKDGLNLDLDNMKYVLYLRIIKNEN